MPPGERGRIDSAEAARRLGVKIETVYAYASRGLLNSRRVPGGRGSTFAIAEVEALAGARSRATDREPFRFPSIASGVALVAENTLHFRGIDAVTLARERTFEEVASWIWTGDWSAEPFVAPAATRELVARAVAALPDSVDITARLRVAVAVAGAVDHLRFDLSPESVHHAARVAIACMVSDSPGDGSVARRLWPVLTPAPADPELVRCLQSALILLADRGLAASTVAVRAAASARANPYAVIGSGLGALDGVLHGGVGTAAYRLLEQVMASGDVERTLAEYLRREQPVPGIGLHGARSDPRAVALLDLLGGAPAAAPALAAARSVTAALRPHGRSEPNIDLATAVLAHAAGMPASAGEAIFGVGRSVGWIAHAVEEYRERPLRWRGRELYTGPRPE